MVYYTEGKQQESTSIRCLRQRTALRAQKFCCVTKGTAKMYGRDGRKLWFRSFDATAVAQVLPWARWQSNFHHIREAKGSAGRLVLRWNREAAPCQPYVGFILTLLTMVDHHHDLGCAFVQPSRQPLWLHWLLY
jgi:hypothetical protein